MEESFSVGIKALDKQHLKIKTILTTLKKDSSNSQKVNAGISKLKTALQNNFKMEEEFFNKLKYPETEQHTLEHQNILQKIEIFSSQENNLFENIQNIEQLISNHIIETDTKYTSFFNERGIR